MGVAYMSGVIVVENLLTYMYCTACRQGCFFVTFCLSQRKTKEAPFWQKDERWKRINFLRFPTFRWICYFPSSHLCEISLSWLFENFLVVFPTIALHLTVNSRIQNAPTHTTHPPLTFSAWKNFGTKGEFFWLVITVMKQITRAASHLSKQVPVSWPPKCFLVYIWWILFLGGGQSLKSVQMA